MQNPCRKNRLPENGPKIIAQKKNTPTQTSFENSNNENMFKYGPTPVPQRIVLLTLILVLGLIPICMKPHAVQDSEVQHIWQSLKAIPHIPKMNPRSWLVTDESLFMTLHFLMHLFLPCLLMVHLGTHLCCIVHLHFWHTPKCICFQVANTRLPKIHWLIIVFVRFKWQY